MHELCGGGKRPAVETRVVRAAGVDLTDTVVMLLGEILMLANGERWLARMCERVTLSDTEAGPTLTGAPLVRVSSLDEKNRGR